MQIKLVHAPSSNELSYIKDKEMADMKKINKETVLHNILSIVIATIINAAIVWAFTFFNDVHPFDFASYDFSFTFPMIIICVLVYLLFGCCIESLYDINCIREYSPKCQYAYYTNGKNVLKCSYKTTESFCSLDYYLELDLEDVQTKRVSYATIGPFTSETRTDVSCRTFDFENKRFYIPYDKEV